MIYYATKLRRYINDLSQEQILRKQVVFTFKMRFFQKCLLITVINIASSGSNHIDNQDPLIIAHRGACGMFPEHTALAYRFKNIILEHLVLVV